ncbi:hypothetical protein BDA96_10G125200 [Sorghum bicolor]|uniref:Uncharacterized protein n=1 Tax=Sorghum bicolor TaxID=4558 RepID=A0A921Q1G2_SORBI|nr:hypothetical protein BDA96_10G125200 [Sorghum bicolor]
MHAWVNTAARPPTFDLLAGERAHFVAARNGSAPSGDFSDERAALLHARGGNPRTKTKSPHGTASATSTTVPARPRSQCPLRPALHTHPPIYTRHDPFHGYTYLLCLHGRT